MFLVPSRLTVVMDCIKLWFGEREKLISHLKPQLHVSHLPLH